MRVIIPLRVLIVPLVLLGGCAVAAAVTLLMVVMRALLQSAVAMHDELAEVI